MDIYKGKKADKSGQLGMDTPLIILKIGCPVPNLKKVQNNTVFNGLTSSFVFVCVQKIRSSCCWNIVGYPVVMSMGRYTYPMFIVYSAL